MCQIVGCHPLQHCRRSDIERNRSRYVDELNCWNCLVFGVGSACHRISYMIAGLELDDVGTDGLDCASPFRANDGRKRDLV